MRSAAIPFTFYRTPEEVVGGIGDLVQHGLLLKYVVASLFRVTWGFVLAVVLAIPLGLAIGWSRRAEMAFNPLIQILRPISPLAWIPIAILWFGVGDLAAIFLIFLGCFLPLSLTAINAVQSIPAVYINAGRNFGLGSVELVYRVLYPAVVPQLIVGFADYSGHRLAGGGGGGDDRREFRAWLSDCRCAQCRQPL